MLARRRGVFYEISARGVLAARKTLAKRQAGARGRSRHARIRALWRTKTTPELCWHTLAHAHQTGRRVTHALTLIT